MKTTKLSLTAVMALGLISSVQAADSIEGMFKEGKVNGSLRFNSFMWDWENYDDNSAAGVKKSSTIAAAGASLLFKTGSYNGVSFGVGAYTSQPINALSDSYATIKSGGDLDLRAEAGEAINVLGQAYVQYDLSKTTATVGRQLINTPLTNANDSKMVPNAFQAYTMTSKDVKDVDLFASWITAMKPRNEDKFNDILSNKQDTPKALTTNMTLSGVSTGGTKVGHTDGMLIIGATYTGVQGVKLEAWNYDIPDVLNTTILEANYNFPIGEVKMNVGGRYLMQRDTNSIANDASWGWGASQNRTKGYKNPNSLDSELYAARVAAQYGWFKAHIGYSQVANKSDIVAAWRGFPTGGYTRPMKIENWDANIKSKMAQISIDLDKAGLLKGTSFEVSYLIDDRDESKSQPKGDMKTITADLNHKFACIKGLEGRLRMGYHNDKGNVWYNSTTSNVATTNRAGWDFTEYRAELMYKF